MPLLHITTARVIDPAAKRDEAAGELFLNNGVFVARPSAAAA